MNAELINKVVQICEEKIEKKGENVGLSFYAFFENRNTDPKALMQVAKWWIETEKLDHFEKAVKIRMMVQRMG
jgi:hypothetical protein